VGTSDATSPHGFLYSNRVMTNLGTLDGIPYSGALRINDKGQIVGAAWSPPRAFLYSDGLMSDLGTLGGWWTGATGMNSSGEIVGVSSTGQGEDRAFLYRRGVMTDLNDLIAPGWRPIEAYDINDAGQIVAMGLTGFGPGGYSEVHGVLLSPVPEPSTLIIWSLLGALSVTFACWRRKRLG